MTDHVHEWVMQYTTIDFHYDLPHYVCKRCGNLMFPEDALSRINAAEQLSAEEAMSISACDDLVSEHVMLLVAYAKARGGE